MPYAQAVKTELEHLILPIRFTLFLLCLAASLPALAQPPLKTFTESRGCKLLGSEAVVKRLQEFAAQGSVTWDGQCKNGLIEGRGVLREEGALVVNGKTRNYAYFFTGTAQRGLRQGIWKRESFERFVDSPKFYTSASTLKFVDGIAKGKPRALVIHTLGQLTPPFKQYVIAAQADAAPANAALVYTATDKPAKTAPSKPVADPLAPTTQSVYSFFPLVTASSQFEQLGPGGLLTFVRPGWQSATPPDYPEWLLIDFRVNREIAMIGLLAQDGHLDRAPKIIRLESSMDGKNWSTLNATEIPCTPNSDGGWLSLGLLEPARGRYLKIVVLANCGDASHVALRGLRFK